MQERIDYVKLSWAANNIDAADVLRERYEGLFAQSQAIEGRLHANADFNRVYDGQGNWNYTLDVSGPGSDAFFYSFLNPLIDYAHLTRLDYRFELDGTLSDAQFDVIYTNARALNTVNRNIIREHARVRNKTSKRDGGGDRVSIGSLSSDRYLAVYRKPSELTAVEFKLSGTPLKRLITEAQLKARTDDKEPGRAYKHLYKGMRERALQHIEDCLGMHPSEICDVQALATVRPEAMAEGQLEHAIKSDFQTLPRAVQLSLLKELVDDTFPTAK